MIKKLYRGIRFWLNPYKALYTKGLGGHGGHPPVVHDRLLQETGFGILQEDGNNILL
jgi:hypothetical protein